MSKNLRDKRERERERERERGGGGNHDFASKLFSLTISNNFLGEPFCFFEKFQVSKNVSDQVKTE